MLQLGCTERVFTSQAEEERRPGPADMHKAERGEGFLKQGMAAGP